MSIQVPIQCAGIEGNITILNSDIRDLQEILDSTGGHDPGITKQLSDKRSLLAKATRDLAACVKLNSGPAFNPAPFGPIPPTPKPQGLSSDKSLRTKSKTISLDLLQKKFDQFFNKRTEEPILKVRFHNHDNASNNPPNSDVELSFIIPSVQAAAGGVWAPTTAYSSITMIDLGQLPYDFYFNDVNSSSINVALLKGPPALLTVKIDFETGGPAELPNSDSALPFDPGLDFSLFNIAVTFSVGFDAVNKKIDLLSWMQEIQQFEKTPRATNPPTVNVTGPFLGQPLDVTLPFLGFDDALDAVLADKIVTVNIKAIGSRLELGGAVQRNLRLKIFKYLQTADDPATQKRGARSSINAYVNRWALGQDGSYEVTAAPNDGQTISINYNVPENVLNPLPKIPAGWPSSNPPSADPRFVPGTLANIDHIVVLSLENRSFDQMLGYLSLPVASGGMGRTDVDGLTGNNSNTYNGVKYPSFPFKPGETVFYPDPQHDSGPVFHQIGQKVDSAGNTAGGDMGGFVKSFAEEAGTGTGDGSTIMGYHTGVNLPVFDALARDFAISHRWFAAHPGPTFCNRFYEITGRLNLTSALDSTTPNGINPAKVGHWEYANSKPLTPVFTRTIFDYLSELNVTWKYYEHLYCFLRFFEKHTFDDTNIVDINDPARGFFANAGAGTLPSVSFIDPHFIELPPDGSDDGPPADVKNGQALVKKVVEAVVAGPKWNKTLLIIIYDEHGGFYDHVKPPSAVKVTPESPITTFGVRVPAFIISPWTIPGKRVFGHDGVPGDALHFDHTSILKTIARRFMSTSPPIWASDMRRLTICPPPSARTSSGRSFYRLSVTT